MQTWTGIWSRVHHCQSRDETNGFYLKSLVTNRNSYFGSIYKPYVVSGEGRCEGGMKCRPCILNTFILPLLKFISLVFFKSKLFCFGLIFQRKADKEQTGDVIEYWAWDFEIRNFLNSKLAKTQDLWIRLRARSCLHKQNHPKYNHSRYQ